MGTTRSIEKQASHFVRCHLGRDAFAPFTGVDYPAWNAFVHLLQLYGRNPTDQVIVALAAVTMLAQAKEAVLRVFVQAIPAVLDWGYVERIWPRVCSLLPCAPENAHVYVATERDGKGKILRYW